MIFIFNNLVLSIIFYLDFIQRSQMRIQYQNNVAPLNATCCFLNPSSRQFQLINTQSKFLKKRPNLNNLDNIQTKQLLYNRKEDIKSMKKSISSISLKRKNSDGQTCYKNSLNQSVLINQSLSKKLTTHSMDQQTLKQYFKPLLNQKSINNNEKTGYYPFQQLNKQQNQFKYETLDSLAQKFKKNKQDNNKTVNITKRSMIKPYEFSKFYTPKQKKKQINITQQIKKPCQQLCKQLKFQKCSSTALSSQKTVQSMYDKQMGENPQFEQNSKILSTNVSSQYYQSNPSHHLTDINQIDSIILSSVNSKFIQFNKSNHTNHIKQTNMIDNTKKIIKINKKNTLKDMDNITVNSDYQQRDDQEVTHTIQESTILINYFHPPSFIKDNISITQKSKIHH